MLQRFGNKLLVVVNRVMILELGFATLVSLHSLLQRSMQVEQLELKGSKSSSMDGCSSSSRRQSNLTFGPSIIRLLGARRLQKLL